MSIDVEYAIKKDIKNNPVVRELDPTQGQEFVRTAWLMAAVVGMVLFSSWQHFEIVRNGYNVQKLEQARVAADSLNRQLRLEVETLRAPQRLERIALEELHMQSPSPQNTLVIERASPSAPDRAAVAAAR
jgi:cell division protein FtsL